MKSGKFLDALLLAADAANIMKSDSASRNWSEIMTRRWLNSTRDWELCTARHRNVRSWQAD